MLGVLPADVVRRVLLFAAVSPLRHTYDQRDDDQLQELPLGGGADADGDQDSAVAALAGVDAGTGSAVMAARANNIQQQTGALDTNADVPSAVIARRRRALVELGLTTTTTTTMGGAIVASCTSAPSPPPNSLALARCVVRRWRPVIHTCAAWRRKLRPVCVRELGLAVAQPFFRLRRDRDRGAMTDGGSLIAGNNDLFRAVMGGAALLVALNPFFASVELCPDGQGEGEGNGNGNDGSDGRSIGNSSDDDEGSDGGIDGDGSNRATKAAARREEARLARLWPEAYATVERVFALWHQDDTPTDQMSSKHLTQSRSGTGRVPGAGLRAACCWRDPLPCVDAMSADFGPEFYDVAGPLRVVAEPHQLSSPVTPLTGALVCVPYDEKQIFGVLAERARLAGAVALIMVHWDRERWRPNETRDFVLAPDHASAESVAAAGRADLPVVAAVRWPLAELSQPSVEWAAACEEFLAEHGAVGG